MKRIAAICLALVPAIFLPACQSSEGAAASFAPFASSALSGPAQTTGPDTAPGITPPEDFVLVAGGVFEMGSPETEAWRSRDEAAHEVTVSDFYISRYEVTQAEYQAVMGENPSSFEGGQLPVDSVSWMDAIRYCNARSAAEGLIPAYTVDDQTVLWDKSAGGYRLPTEAEWEYACRAGTKTPFNTETSISAEEANYWGDYPYMIEDNYFNQGNLETKPGVYRQTTVEVNSFEPNALGLYNMHGNVGEWVWDWYGDYDTAAQADPTGPDSGTRRVYRGGGWNDFAKNLRSAYRAALPPRTRQLCRWAAAGAQRKRRQRKRTVFPQPDRRADGRCCSDRLFLLGRQHKEHCRGTPAPDRGRPL